MKSTLTLVLAFVLCGAINAQEGGSLSKKEQRQLLKEERIKEESRMAELKSIYIDSLVQSGSYVLEADMLFDKYGQSITVQSNINFVMVDSLFGVFQIGDPFYISRNGVGGVTYEGSVNNYRSSRSAKQGVYNISYTLSTTSGSFDINLSVLPSGKADATVRGNFSGSVRYSGRIVGRRESRVFKGTAFSEPF